MSEFNNPPNIYAEIYQTLSKIFMPEFTKPYLTTRNITFLIYAIIYQTPPNDKKYTIPVTHISDCDRNDILEFTKYKKYYSHVTSNDKKYHVMTETVFRSIPTTRNILFHSCEIFYFIHVTSAKSTSYSSCQCEMKSTSCSSCRIYRLFFIQSILYE